MNRVNSFILIFLSLALSFLVAYLYVKGHIEKEPQIILAPLKIEVYRIDRHPLPGADIYLNQSYIGKTDDNGIFTKDMNLTEGESYLLRVERLNDGYVFGPWETHFKVEEEKKEQRGIKRDKLVEAPSLEGEFDILSEIERAQLGKASLYERYHFLAILDGYMYYTVRVLGRNEATIENAKIIVNGVEEGKTDERGIFMVKYSGEDKRLDNIQIYKDGEHVWINEEFIQPKVEINIELNKMLIIDLYAYTENYDVIRGIKEASVYLGQKLMAKTNEEGFCSFKYINERGVDGYLELTIQYPPDFLPFNLKKIFKITKDIPKLSITEFVYNKKALNPKVAIIPLTVKNPRDYFLIRQAQGLKSMIEDFLSLGGVFTLVPGKEIEELFQRFNLDIRRQNVGWKEIPLIKKEVDTIIIGEIGSGENALDVRLKGIDYTGEIIQESDDKVALREMQSFTEDFIQNFKYNYPFEGSITAINKNIYINLGRAHGVQENNKFYGFYSFFDNYKKSYSPKRVAKLNIVETGEDLSAGELETVNEGILLDAGVKVKRYREPFSREEERTIVLNVTSDNKPLLEANVYINDQWFGQTDSEGKASLSLSTNSLLDLLVYKEGYLPEKMSVKIQKDTSVITLRLKQGSSLFTIESVPEGALVFIDGELMGNTPVTKNPLTVTYGFHLLEIELKGYKKYRNYVNFSESRVSFTEEESIYLYRDLFFEAEDAFNNGDIQKAVELLSSITAGHPDYRRAIELLGFIFLKYIQDYQKAIDYYNEIVKLNIDQYKAREDLITYFNLGQACYNEAERVFYTSKSLSQTNYLKAIFNFNFVKENRSMIPAQKRKWIYQDALFYLSVSYQKLYYLTSKYEYLLGAQQSWIDYFDHFDKKVLNDDYYKNQYAVAETYRKEIGRLRGENG